MLDFKKLIAHREKQQETSETYKEQVTAFLDRLKIKKERVKKPTFRILSHILTDLSLPHKEEQIRIRTQQQINLISLILKMIDQHQTIDDLLIATYTLNKEAFGILQDLLRHHRIQKLTLFLASAYSFRSPEEYETFKSTVRSFQSQGYAVYLVFAWLHFKITLARCGTEYYHFEGSMNYSTNNMAEQLVFENRRDIYDFDAAFFRDIVLVRDHKGLEIIGDSPDITMSTNVMT